MPSRAFSRLSDRLASLLPSNLATRLTALFVVATLSLTAIAVVVTQQLMERRWALASSHLVGAELTLALEDVQRGVDPASRSPQHITMRERLRSADTQDGYTVLLSFDVDGDPLHGWLEFPQAPARRDLIASNHTIVQRSHEAMSDLSHALARQDETISLFIELPEHEEWVLEVSAPDVWQERATGPLVVVLAILACGLVITLSNLLLSYIVSPFAALARDEHMPIGKWNSEEAIALERMFVEQREARARLLAEQTRMLASISHDLRTPVTRLRLRAEQIESASLRNAIVNDVEEMVHLTTESLNFLRYDARNEEPQKLSFASLLEGLCDDYADTGRPVTFMNEKNARATKVSSVFGGEGDFEYELEGRAIMVGRAVALRRAFTNLIDNALKYGGSAEVRLDCHLPDKLQVMVSDSGPGIPQELREKVFEPFFRSKQHNATKEGGVGLGLSIVQQVITAHNGAIHFGETADGRFCIFVDLPR